MADVSPEAKEMNIQGVALASLADRRKRVFRLAWPVSAELGLQTLVQVIDMAMVGRLGADSIAAVGLSFRPLFVGQAIFLGLGVATTAMVARFIGAKQDNDANTVTEQALLTTSVLALSLSLFAYFAARNIVIFMGGQDSVIELGTSYMHGFAPGLFFMLVATIMTSAFRASGDTKTPLKVNILTNVINVFGNWLLIFGHLGFPALGVYGAAVATSFSRFVGAIIMFAVLLKGRGGLHLTPAGFTRLNISLITRLFRIGIPAAFERIVMSVSVMLHVKLVAYLGTVAVAAATVSSGAEQLSYMPALGFSVAASTLVGQKLGAKMPGEAQKYAIESMKMAAVFMGIMGILFVSMPRLFVAIYTSDPEVVPHAVVLLRIVGISQIPMALSQVTSGSLRGAGDTSSVLWITVVSTIIVRLGLTYLFIMLFEWGVWSAWIAMFFDWIVKVSFLVWRFAAGSWKTLKV